MLSISVLTIVHDRPQALINLLLGLTGSELVPAELVIVHMNEPPYPLPATPFPVRQHQLTTQHQLPLAQARNLAVSIAQADHLVFLDADCIPHPHLLTQYTRAFEQPHCLYAGRVRYLTAGPIHSTDLSQTAGWEQLHRRSEPDPIRAELPTLPYELFWSLNFGCSRQTFTRIGAFDERFVGYGAEDTDFSFAARQAGIPLENTSALAYHQHHPSYSPPLNHLADIVTNAQLFKQKWQVWPMPGWLTAFAQQGYVQWSADQLRLLRQPTASELAQARRD